MHGGTTTLAVGAGGRGYHGHVSTQVVTTDANGTFTVTVVGPLARVPDGRGRRGRPGRPAAAAGPVVVVRPTRSASTRRRRRSRAPRLSKAATVAAAAQRPPPNVTPIAEPHAR